MTKLLVKLQTSKDTLRLFIKNFKITIVTKLSVNQSKLHINSVHEGVKNYKCDLCDKVYSRPTDIKRHIIGVHEGQKNYKCDICGKAFKQSSHLKRHIKNLI